MSQTSYLLQFQAEEPLFLMALVIYSSKLSHGIYASVFSSTSLNSPSGLFISCSSFLPPSPSIGLWLVVGFEFLSGRFGGERMQRSRKHQLYSQKCRVCRVNRITQMEQAISSPATHTAHIQKGEEFPALSDKVIDHWEEVLIKEGASQSYIFPKICVPQFASGHKKGQCRPLWRGTEKKYQMGEILGVG